ncbi:MAG: sugar phosphate isomerase/epimerase family protein [Nitrospinota bacterium]|nr:sugar phosphate isomerase/epimerase family protein [Nitrospinota bacterium]
MKISFQVATIDVNTPLLPAIQGNFEENLDVLSKLGYDGIEISMRKPEELDFDLIQKQVQSRGMEVSAVHTAGIGFQDKVWMCHPDPNIRKVAMKRLKGCCDAASFYGVEVIVGSFRGKLSEGEEREESLKWMYDAFKESSDYAASKGTRVLFEPQHRFSINFGFTTQDGIRFIEEINSPGFGIMLDTFHMNVEDTSFAASIFDSKDHLGILHIADSNRKYPGSGHIPWRDLISSLQAINYEGFLSLQIKMDPDFETAAKLGIDYLRSLI